MGSYLTIVNNTPYDWQCKVGPDMKALKISGIAFGVISAALTMIAITGAALALIAITTIPVVAAMSTGGMIAWGLPIVAVTGLPGFGATGLAASGIIAGAAATGAAIGVGAVATIAGATSAAAFGASNVASATSFSLAVTEALYKKLSKKGFDLIKAGESRRYGKMTLSLWQQSECIKKTIKGPMVEVETLYMRPIFSGSLINSNRDHEIEYWLLKHGTKTFTIEGKNETKSRSLEENDEAIQYITFFPNGTAQNQNGVQYPL